jgi:NMD protein affecting ribosome stability and mRNA decay
VNLTAPTLASPSNELLRAVLFLAKRQAETHGIDFSNSNTNAARELVTLARALMEMEGK